MAKGTRRNTPPGPAVDASGQTVRDPTENVIELIKEVRSHTKQMGKSDSRRQDELRKADDRRVSELAKSDRRHTKVMAKKEAELRDTLRANDQAAILTDRSARDQQAATLAKTLSDTAEAARTTLAATADAASKNVAAIVGPILARLDEIQRIQYQEAGQRAQVQESKIDTRATDSNRGMNLGLVVAFGAVIVTIVLGIIGIVLTILLNNNATTTVCSTAAGVTTCQPK